MAAHYVAEIRSRQPVGPYFVGGLCAGGLIAFEVARQIEQAGERIGLLALFEAAPPHAKKRASVTAERWERFTQAAPSASLSEKVRRAVGKIEGFARYESRELRNKVRARAGVLLLRHVFHKAEGWPERFPPPTVREVFLRAESEYVATTLNASRVLLVRSREGTGSDLPYRLLLEDEVFGWREVIRELDVIDVDGGHSTMLQEPNVEEIARVVRAAFERVRPVVVGAGSSAVASERRA
jgi:thioesterase domain-containing protein